MPISTTVRHLGGAIGLLALLSLASPSQDHDRSKIPDQYKWDLTAIYPADQEWRNQKEKLATELPKLREFRGTLASSAQRLADALETRSRLEKERRGSGARFPNVGSTSTPPMARHPEATLTMKKMNRVMGEIEALLAQKDGNIGVGAH
jgi:hypothetical protein